MPIPPISPNESLINPLVVDELISKTLKGDSVITSYVGGRVFEYSAPKGSIFPYIVFNNQSPPRDIRGLGTATIMADAIYTIKVIDEGTSYLPLKPIVDRIYELFHGIQSTTADEQEGLVISMMHEEIIKYHEVDSGKHYRHLGGMYRVLTGN